VATITIGGTADVTMARFPALRGDSAVTTITSMAALPSYASSLTYMTNLTHAYLTANGANINVASGNDIVIGQALEDEPSQTGVLTKAGEECSRSPVQTPTAAARWSAGRAVVDGSIGVGPSRCKPAAHCRQGHSGGATTIQAGAALSPAHPWAR